MINEENMRQKYRSFLISLTILAVLMLNAVYTVPAYADDSAPPVPESSAVEEVAPLDSDTVATTTESAPSEDVPAADGPAPQPESTTEVLAQIPEDTNLVILDENGEVLPLASQDAEDVILIRDPIWCPTGVAPKPNTGGCSGSFGSLGLLVAGFVPPAKNGTIWIEQGTDAMTGGNVVIDGAERWAPAANFSLTLQGGWIGGVTGSNSTPGVSLFDSAIIIVNWNGAVTVKDIVIDNASNANDPDTGALYVQTTKNIVISNVVVSDTAGTGTEGAFLDNTASTRQASVTVKNSTFNNNYGGLVIQSDGAVTLTNVTANQNNVTGGVYIDNAFDDAASTVSVTQGFFLQNTGTGLEIYSNGAIKLSQIVANGNSGNGVRASNVFATSAYPVSMSDFLTALNNGADGLRVTSEGAVTLTNLTTNDNGGRGTSIDNQDSVLPAKVTISGTNFFNNNQEMGLAVFTKGAITTNNITAIYNGYTGDRNGVYLSNADDITMPQNVTMNGTNVFNWNSSSGLSIGSYGTVTLSNVTAWANGLDVVDNTGHGVYIDNMYAATPKGVTIKGTSTFQGNERSGLTIYSAGPVSLNNISASYNAGGFGAYVENNSAFQSPVKITGYGLFDQNGMDGLYILSSGPITTNNVSASENSGNGAFLSTTGITRPQAINMKGSNSFAGNGDASTESGLIVSADGNITVNNLVASENYYMGASLDSYSNWSSGSFPAFGSISVTGFGNFASNSSDGLNIHTNGNVVLNNVTATYNINDGVSVTANGKVTLACVMVTNNLFGFRMYANTPLLTIKGLISLANTSGQESLMATTTVRTRCP
jgi:hypothetical protein